MSAKLNSLDIQDINQNELANLLLKITSSTDNCIKDISIMNKCLDENLISYGDVKASTINNIDKSLINFNDIFLNANINSEINSKFDFETDITRTTKHESSCKQMNNIDSHDFSLSETDVDYFLNEMFKYKDLNKNNIELDNKELKSIFNDQEGIKLVGEKSFLKELPESHVNNCFANKTDNLENCQQGQNLKDSYIVPIDIYNKCVIDIGKLHNKNNSCCVNRIDKMDFQDVNKSNSCESNLFVLHLTKAFGNFNEITETSDTSSQPNTLKPKTISNPAKRYSQHNNLLLNVSAVASEEANKQDNLLVGVCKNEEDQCSQLNNSFFKAPIIVTNNSFMSNSLLFDALPKAADTCNTLDVKTSIVERDSLYKGNHLSLDTTTDALDTCYPATNLITALTITPDKSLYENKLFNESENQHNKLLDALSIISKSYSQSNKKTHTSTDSSDICSPPIDANIRSNNSFTEKLSFEFDFESNEFLQVLNNVLHLRNGESLNTNYVNQFSSCFNDSISYDYSNKRTFFSNRWRMVYPKKSLPFFDDEKKDESIANKVRQKKTTPDDLVSTSSCRSILFDFNKRNNDLDTFADESILLDLKTRYVPPEEASFTEKSIDICEVTYSTKHSVINLISSNSKFVSSSIENTSFDCNKSYINNNNNIVSITNKNVVSSKKKSNLNNKSNSISHTVQSSSTDDCNYITSPTKKDGTCKSYSFISHPINKYSSMDDSKDTYANKVISINCSNSNKKINLRNKLDGKNNSNLISETNNSNIDGNNSNHIFKMSKFNSSIDIHDLNQNTNTDGNISNQINMLYSDKNNEKSKIISSYSNHTSKVNSFNGNSSSSYNNQSSSIVRSNSIHTNKHSSFSIINYSSNIKSQDSIKECINKKSLLPSTDNVSNMMLKTTVNTSDLNLLNQSCHEWPKLNKVNKSDELIDTQLLDVCQLSSKTTSLDSSQSISSSSSNDSLLPQSNSEDLKRKVTCNDIPKKLQNVVGNSLVKNQKEVFTKSNRENSHKKYKAFRNYRNFSYSTSNKKNFKNSNHLKQWENHKRIYSPISNRENIKRYKTDLLAKAYPGFKGNQEQLTTCLDYVPVVTSPKNRLQYYLDKHPRFTGPIQIYHPSVTEIKRICGRHSKDYDEIEDVIYSRNDVKNFDLRCQLTEDIISWGRQINQLDCNIRPY